jgi:hypothetical protein
LAQPKPYEPPTMRLDEDPSCLALTIDRGAKAATVLVRNTCALRVNWSMCVKRSDDAAPTFAKGSLSPAAVDEHLIPFTSKTTTFAHAETFCSGLTCEVATPQC